MIWFSRRGPRYWRWWPMPDGGRAGYSYYGWPLSGLGRACFWLFIGWWALGGLWLAVENAMVIGGLLQIGWAWWWRRRTGRPYTVALLFARWHLVFPAALRPDPLPPGVTSLRGRR